MAVYKVPQDVEADDKLLGPFSFKQFIFLIIAIAGLVLAWILAQVAIPLLLLPLPVALFFGVLALPLRKDQPMEIYVAAVISFLMKPRIRLWEPDGVESLVEVVAPKVEERQYGKGYDRAEVQRRLSYLANLVDTRGWAVRGVSDPNAPVSAMHEDLYNEAQTADDVLDRNNATSQQIDALMSQASERRRQAVIDRMRQPHTPEAQGVFQQPEIAQTPQLQANPYPQQMHQAVISPLGVRSSSAVSTAAPSEASPSQSAVSPDIIDLANNHADLSVATLQREANRIQQRAEEKAAEEEVVISLR